MKKTTQLLIIMLTLISCFAINQIIISQQQAQSLAAARLTTQRLVSTMQDVNQWMSHYYRSRFAQSSGNLVLQIGMLERVVRTEIHTEIDFLQRSPMRYQADSVNVHLADLQDSLRLKVSDFFTSQQADLGLNNEGAQQWIARMEQLLFPITPKGFATSKLLTPHELESTILNLLNLEYALTTQIVSCISIRDIQFSTFYPVVIPDQNQLIARDTFRARIGMGYYYRPTDVQDLSLTVNGKSAQIGEDGLAYHTFTPQKAGVYQMDLAAKIRNNLTGEFSEANSKFEYRVVDCKLK